MGKGNTVTIDYADGIEVPTATIDLWEPVPPADAVLDEANQMYNFISGGSNVELADQLLAEDLKDQYPNISITQIDQVVDDYIDKTYLVGAEHFRTPLGKSPFGSSLDDPARHPSLHGELEFINEENLVHSLPLKSQTEKEEHSDGSITITDINTGAQTTYIQTTNGSYIPFVTVVNGQSYEVGMVKPGYELSARDRWELEQRIRASIDEQNSKDQANGGGTSRPPPGHPEHNQNDGGSGSSGVTSGPPPGHPEYNQNSGGPLPPSGPPPGHPEYNQNSGGPLPPSGPPPGHPEYNQNSGGSQSPSGPPPGHPEHNANSGKPIVVDLDGDGIEFSPLGESSAKFDFDSDGFRELTAWVGADDGLLVYDVGNDNQITSSKEIAFAEWTVDSDDTDLDGLKSVFDTNNDGYLDNRDTNWSGFKIWNDANQNGAVDSGEMSSLTESGIKSFKLQRKENSKIEFSEGSILHGLIDIEKTDGTMVLGGDMEFAYNSLGVRESIQNGVRTVEFENGSSLTFKVFEASLRNYVLSGDVLAAVGNAYANVIDGSGQDRALMLSGAEGNDTIKGGSSNDVITGGLGADKVDAGKGDDIVYGDKEDKIQELRGGDGYDQLIMTADSRLKVSDLAAQEFEAVRAGDLSDSISGTDNDVDYQLYGNGGDDSLSGAGGSDLLAGGQDSDQLKGSYGDDILIGGTGKDRLQGGDDDDTYIFRRGDGQDTILDQVIGEHEVEYDYTAKWQTGGKRKKTVTETRTGIKTVTGEHDAGIDMLQFGSGIFLEDISMKRDGSDMIIELHSRDEFGTKTGDSVKIEQWSDTNNRIELLGFVGGSRLDVSQVEDGFVGSAGNDRLSGKSSVDFFAAGDGNDSVHADGGNDYIVAGKGNDELHGEAGDDTIWGGDGNDAMHGGASDDVLYGGDGADTLKGGAGRDYLQGQEGNDLLSGGEGDDILLGGAGNDTMQGGAGNDTYHWLYGDGKDTILDQHTIQETYQEAYTVRVRRSGKRRARWVNETRHRTKTRTVEKNGGDDTLAFGFGLSLENLAFDLSGSSLRVGLRDPENASKQMDSLENVVSIQQWSDANNRIEELRFSDGKSFDTSEVTSARSGYSGNDNLVGQSGGDILSGGSGNDNLRGLDGIDYLIGGTGNDTLDGGAGDDDLFGGAGNDQILGGDGDDYLLGYDGADVLQGGKGKDVLVGGTGNDTLKGGLDDDTYIFTKGGGKDVIDESAFIKEAYQYTERVAKTVAAYKTVTTYKTVRSGKWSYRKKFTKRVRNGTRKIWVNETRTGYRNKAVEGGNDILQFSGAIEISDLLVNTTGNDLVVQLEPSETNGAIEDQVTIKQWNHHQFRIEAFVFQNGFRLETEKISYAKTGTDANENILTTREGRESWLSGRGGNDVLSGSSFSDILIGGTGNDRLLGGRGDDVYVFNAGDGQDTIYDSGSVTTSKEDLQLMNGEVFGDKIVFGRGITIEDISLTRSGADLNIYVRKENADDWQELDAIDDIITVKDWANSGKRIEALQFYDGTDLDVSEVVNAWVGTSGANNHRGSTSGDWLDAGLGADTVYGNSGDDYILGRGDNDHLYGDAGDDVLFGGVGADILAGGSGDDFLMGGTENDTLNGGSGSDILAGGDGDDVFNSGDGDDVIIGGAGNDLFQASRGQDIYRFGYGDGQDTYEGNGASNPLGPSYANIPNRTANTDIVIIEGQLDKGAIWFKRIDNSLVMQLVGSEDKITFTNWFKANQTNGASHEYVSAFVLGEEMLLAKDVNQLVSAMASFDPNDGTTAYGVKAHELPEKVQVAVNSSWQVM